MADGDVKKMDAVLSADPCSEMDAKTEAWVKSIPALKKILAPVKYSQKVELDGRKWNASKLSKALEALVRYELKLFAQRGAEWHKKFQKQKPGAQDKVKAEAEKAYPRDYKKLVKEIEKKCSLALEELESDKGDNRKALRDGKAAMRRLAALELKDIFRDPREGMVRALKALETDLKSAGADARAKDKAYQGAAAAVAQARQDYDKDCRDAEAALKYLAKMAGDTRRNKDVNPKLKAFAAKVDRYSRDFDLLVKKLEGFDKDIGTMAKAVAGRKLDAQKAAAAAKSFDKYRNLDNVAKTAINHVRVLTPEFAKIEKDLK